MMSDTSVSAVARVPLPTALGRFEAVLSQDGLCSLHFPNESDRSAAWLARHFPGAPVRDRDPRTCGLAGELDAYLRGELRDFSATLDLRGTPFQRRVWGLLRLIPYGEVRSYAAIAGALGRHSAVRAVGAANGANPVPVIVPCHRVIGSSGSLVGFGAGLDWKRRLLAIENPARWGPARLPGI
jgi:methylated-DNA-[protein]-cysteine S-methyltransferase